VAVAVDVVAVAVAVALVEQEWLGARTTPVNDPSETRRFFFFGRELLKSVCGSPSDIARGAARGGGLSKTNEWPWSKLTYN
jgi:hypothetical protein